MGIVVLALMAQVPTFGPVRPPTVPDYAWPVQAMVEPPLADDPAILCIHRPLSVSYDKGAMTGAATRILQIGAFTQVMEAGDPDAFGIPRLQSRISAQGRYEGRAWNRNRRAYERMLDASWGVFHARVYEVRMFVHRPVEAKLAARRSVQAWSALRGQLLGGPSASHPSLAREIGKIDEQVAILAEQAAR